MSQGGPVRAMWLLFGLVLVATVVTYWRLSPGATYRFTDSGLSGAISRSVTYLNFPVALAAIAVLLVAGRGRLVTLAVLLCLVAVLPGVNGDDHLMARWVNVPAAVGTVLALVLSWPHVRRHWRHRRGSVELPPPASPGLFHWASWAALAVGSLPWLVACIGFYGSDVPLLGHVIRAAQPTPGEPTLPSVHRGLHEGLLGALLATTVLLLSLYRPRRRLARAYLAGLATYGGMVSAADGWNEQVIKRGWTTVRLPDVLQPSLSRDWAVLLVAAALLYLAWSWRERTRATSETAEWPVPG